MGTVKRPDGVVMYVVHARIVNATPSAEAASGDRVMNIH